MLVARVFHILLSMGAIMLAGAAAAYPVTVRSCFDDTTFTSAPKRAVVNEANMTQTIIDLGLADRMAGFGHIGGVEDRLKAPPALIARIMKKEISSSSPTKEVLLGMKADFYFAGWNYGFSQGTGVTPGELAKYGIKTYALYESCVRIGKRAPLSLEVAFSDILAIGRIFGVEARANAIVASLRRRAKDITDRTRLAKKRYRVMFCGDCSGNGPPLTAGAEGMPSLLTKLAGGRNIFDDIRVPYDMGSWEALIDRDPEWIIISDHWSRAEAQIRYLTSAPMLRNVTAVRKRQFVIMSLAERSPSTRNVDALNRLARAMHPELFPR